MKSLAGKSWKIMIVVLLACSFIAACSTPAVETAKPAAEVSKVEATAAPAATDAPAASKPAEAAAANPTLEALKSQLPVPLPDIAKALPLKDNGKQVKAVYVYKNNQAALIPFSDTLAAARSAQFNLDYIMTGPENGDMSKQVEMIDGYVAAGVDILMVSSLGPSTCAAVDRAVAAGVTVVMEDGDCQESTRPTFVGADNYAGGVKAAELYKEAIDKKGDKSHQRILVLTGAPGAYNLGQRDLGFTDQLTKLGVDYEIANKVACYEDFNKAVDAVEAALRGDPTINGLYMDGPWALLSEPSTKPLMAEMAKSGKLTVISFDTIASQIEYVKQGIVYGEVGQSYAITPYQAINVAVDIYMNKTKYPAFVNLPLVVVTKEGGEGRFTPDEYLEMWNKNTWDLTPAKPE